MNNIRFFVAQVEAPSVSGTIKIPIAVLKIGEQRVVQSNLEFPEGPVTFRLLRYVFIVEIEFLQQ